MKRALAGTSLTNSLSTVFNCAFIADQSGSEASKNIEHKTNLRG